MTYFLDVNVKNKTQLQRVLKQGIKVCVFSIEGNEWGNHAVKFKSAGEWVTVTVPWFLSIKHKRKEFRVFVRGEYAEL